MTTLSEWLRSEGLLKCHSGLRKEGVESTRELTELTEEDFFAIGVEHNWGRLFTRRLITVVRSWEEQYAGTKETWHHPGVRWPKLGSQQWTSPPTKVVLVKKTTLELEDALNKMKPASWRRTVSLVSSPRGQQLQDEAPIRFPQNIGQKTPSRVTMVSGCLSLEILDEDGTPYTVIQP